jgi:hypothetical protein
MSGGHNYADEWRYKMEFLWQYKDEANVFILGSSRALRGINPSLISQPLYAINLAVSANTTGGDYFLLANYLLPHMKSIKVIITSIDIDRWYITGADIFEFRYKSYPGYVYDRNHNFWKDGYPEGLAEATYDSPGKTETAASLRPTRGFSTTSPITWGAPVVAEDSSWKSSQPQNYEANFNNLVKTINICQQNDIIMIGVITPQNPRYKETGSFGKYGILRSEAPTLIQQIADLSTEYPNFILMDENKMGDHDYTDDMAYDRDHLAAPGAAQLTARIDSLIKTLNIVP